MVRKISSYTLFILAICFVLSGCGTSKVIDAKVNSAVSGSSSSDEAIEWLIINGDIMIPELANRVSNAGGNKAEHAAKALIAMGNYGRQGMIQRFDTMTMEGRKRICTVLAEQGDKQAVLELLAISTHTDAFDMAVEAIVSMGDVAMNYLAGQLHEQYYKEAVDAALAGFGEKAVDIIIPAVHSTNDEKVDRALGILTNMGEGAVEKLAIDAIKNSPNIAEAKRIAEMMLKNYSQSAITAIMSNIKGDVRSEIVASLLFEVSGKENIGLVLMQTSLGDAQMVQNVLKEYVKLSAVDPVLQLTLNGDEKIAQGAKCMLSGGEYDEQTFTAILNNINEYDNKTTKIYGLATELLIDANLRTLAQSIISQDTNEFMQVVSSNMRIDKMGSILSLSSHNPSIVNRLTNMTNTMQGEQKRDIMCVLACASDDWLPLIVLNAYAAGGENGNLAAEALTLTPVASGKFMFNKIDMLPYAGKIVEGLTSKDNMIKSRTQQILFRVSTATTNNEFYKTIFSYYKDRTVFSILASHLTGVDAIPVNLSFEKNGTTITPKTISLKIKGDVKNVSSSKEPKYDDLIKGFAAYLGVTLVESGADVELVFDCDITPRSKRYSGLLDKSFLGAEASGKMTAIVGGKTIATATGSATILPPDEYPGPASVFVYKNDEEDAPSDEAFVICFINTMYNMWGEEALLGLYNYNMVATNAAAERFFAK
jgi:hypothetical protein